jgi:hypothetical protein
MEQHKAIKEKLMQIAYMEEAHANMITEERSKVYAYASMFEYYVDLWCFVRSISATRGEFNVAMRHAREQFLQK